MDNNLLIYIMYGIEGVFVIAFLVFSFIFFRHRLLLNTEYVIKEKYNELHQSVSSNKFKYLESLAKNNVQLSRLLESANNSKNFFQQQLGNVKEKIIVLTESNEKYRFKASHILIEEIKNDFLICDKMNDKLSFINSNATEYSKNVSELLVQYRTILDETMNFYEYNLSLRYDNEIFKNMAKSIDAALVESSQFLTKIANDELLQSLNQLNDHISNFFNTVLDLYILNRLFIYAITLQNKVRDVLSQKARSLSVNETIDIEKKSTLAGKNIDDLKRQLGDIHLKMAFSSAIIAISNLERANLKIEQGVELNILVQQSSRLLSNEITKICERIKEITESFIFIKNYFGKKNPEISQKIDEYSVRLQSLTLSYQTIVGDMKVYETIERQKIIARSKELLLDIQSWKKDLTDLIADADEKHRKSILILNELADIRLTLNQIAGIKKTIGITDSVSMQTIENNLTAVNSFQNKLEENYFENYDTTFDELRKIKKQAITLMETTFFDDTLKLYCQRMIMFLNKYRNEAHEIMESIVLAEQYYGKRKYEDALNILIETASAIKSSAKVNKLSLI